MRIQIKKARNTCYHTSNYLLSKTTVSRNHVFNWSKSALLRSSCLTKDSRTQPSFIFNSPSYGVKLHCHLSAFRWRKEKTWDKPLAIYINWYWKDTGNFVNFPKARTSHMYRGTGKWCFIELKWEMMGFNDHKACIHHRRR